MPCDPLSTPHPNPHLAPVPAASDGFARDAAFAVAKNAVTSSGLVKSARVPERVAKMTRNFTYQVEPQGAITHQDRSGRCWMFAALNVMRFEIMREWNLETFEFSQSYPLFFDKLERSNWFLCQVLDMLDEPLDGREMAFLLSDPLGDGGQWDMFMALVRKYGVVPKEAMPETACSSNTREMDVYLTKLLRGYAAELRRAHEAGEPAEGLRGRIPGMLVTVRRALCVCLGEPPATFDLRVRDKDKHLVEHLGMTPLGFYRDHLAAQFDGYVSVISANTADKPFGRTYTVERLGNVAEAGQVKHLNLPIARLKELALAMLRGNKPVWFGSDVGQSALRDDGLLDPAAVDVASIFGAPVEMDRATRLDYGDSCMTHAMVLQGVDVDAVGKTTQWRVENSWGKDFGNDGFYIMDDAWFDEFVYQIAVPKALLTDEERAQWEAEPVNLRPWDPMGTLATVR